LLDIVTTLSRLCEGESVRKGAKKEE